jgi:hypothetical protein
MEKKGGRNFTNPFELSRFLQSPTFKNSHFSISNFCFVSNTSLPLNIAVKLNGKNIKGILVISYIFVKFNRKP